MLLANVEDCAEHMIGGADDRCVLFEFPLSQAEVHHLFTDVDMGLHFEVRALRGLLEYGSGHLVRDIGSANAAIQRLLKFAPASCEPGRMHVGEVVGRRLHCPRECGQSRESCVERLNHTAPRRRDRGQQQQRIGTYTVSAYSASTLGARIIC